MGVDEALGQRDRVDVVISDFSSGASDVQEMCRAGPGGCVTGAEGPVAGTVSAGVPGRPDQGYPGTDGGNTTADSAL